MLGTAKFDPELVHPEKHRIMPEIMVTIQQDNRRISESLHLR